MSDKLKLFSISFGTFDQDRIQYYDPIFYIFSIQDFFDYYKSTDYFLRLKKYFGVDGSYSFIQCPYDNKHIDYRNCVLPVAQHLFYSYLLNTSSSSCKFYVKVRVKTLCFDTSNNFYSVIYSEGFTPFVKGYHNAMFPSALCLSKRLLKSRNWQEYNFISEKRT